MHKRFSGTALSFGLVTAIWLGAGVSASAATLMGDEIDITLTGGIALQDLDVLVGSGVEIVGGNNSTNFGSFLFSGESIDIGASSISMAFDTSLGSNGMLTFGDLDFGAGIGDVYLTSTIDSVTQDHVSFTANSIALDLTDWFSVGGPANLDLSWTEAVSAEVPLPAGGVLLLAGIGAIPVMRRTRRARRAAG